MKILALGAFAMMCGVCGCVQHHRQPVIGSAVSLDLGAMEQLQCDLLLSEGDTAECDSGYRFVVYHDSAQCTPCTISHFGKWHRFAHLQDNSAIRFRFIFHPSANDVAELRSLCGSVRYNIYLDSLGVFERDNELLVKKLKARAFLLDSDNRIVFVGDPTKDIETQEAYLHIMDSLNAQSN